MMKSKNIVYDDGIYFILKVKDGLEVYRQYVTHNVLLSQIGYKGDIGLDRAIEHLEYWVSEDDRKDHKV